MDLEETNIQYEAGEDLDKEVISECGVAPSNDIDEGNYPDDDMLSLTDSVVSDKGPVRQKTFTQKQRVEMIHLRGQLDRLNAKVTNKQYYVNKQREELKLCRQRLNDLSNEDHSVMRQIAEASSQENMAAMYRLMSQQQRIKQEVQGERQLESHLLKVLEDLEYDLTLAHIEQGRYLLDDVNLKKKEEDYREHQKVVAKKRQTKEQKFADQTSELYEHKEKQRQKMEELEEINSRLTKEKVKAAHEKHNKFLKETMEHIRTVRQREEEIHRRELEKKIKSVSNLKSDITKNRENLRSLHARDRANSAEEARKEEELRHKILSQGGDSSFAVLQERKKVNNLKQQIEFKQQQREREFEAAAKIANENFVMERKRLINPDLFETPEQEKRKHVKAYPQKKLRTMELWQTESNLLNEPFEEVIPDSVTYPRTISDDEDSSDMDEDEEDDPLGKFAEILVKNKDISVEELAQPEFEGLWDKHRVYTIPNPEPVKHIRNPDASKMEQEIMSRALEQTRKNIVTKQVAAGREFEGQAFYSKPDMIHFKDFEVNRVYKKRLVLTNVSYTINYCRLVGLTERLKDFIELEFHPPGQLSAGMTCELNVTFSPKINEDLTGEVNFLSQTGPFSIPINCSTKKCDLTVDKKHIDFGISVIGETLKRHFILKNNGAKGTKFTFSKKVVKSTPTTSYYTIDQLLTPEPAAASVNKENSQMESEEDHKDSQESQLVEESAEPVVDLLDCMSTGEVISGEMGPFSQQQLQIIWTPHLSDKYEFQFVLSFEDEASDDILIDSVGQAIDVPVWVERSTVDLKICMYDRLYQDTLIINNRASTALALKFEVCPALKNHIELLPKTGFIQAHSQFSAQIKFLPGKSLPADAGEYFDSETHILEIPMVIRVANQTRPVEFTVQAVVTTSDMELSHSNIDFGYCTIYEKVIQRIQLTNHSLLPQKYGFVELPEYVEVQPNDGFGVLLPQETIDLDVLFSPSKADEYSFQLHCKSLINRSLFISCTGIGVHPPLDLSDHVVNFPATVLKDANRAAIFVLNSHTSMNQYSHPVPRIGSGEVVQMGSTSFEFVPPPNCPVKLSPCVGTLEPGKRERIHIRFAPDLSDHEIRMESHRQAQFRLEQEAQLEYEQFIENQKKAMEEAERKKGSSKRGKSPSSKNKNKQNEVDLSNGPREVFAPPPESIDPESDDYASGIASLMRQFPGQFETVRIPCYVATGHCPLDPGTLPYIVHNTLYLDVHCPSIRPKLVIISNSGRNEVDFEGVCIGQVVTKSITVQNISNETLQLTTDNLDPNGPFQLLNALRTLKPSAYHTIQIQFSCLEEQAYYEVLHVNTGTTKLAIILLARGVTPILQLQGLENGDFHSGTVLCGEYVERQFSLINPTSLDVQFSVNIQSSAPLSPDKRFSKDLIGVQNYSGRSVFDCNPASAILKPSEMLNVTVTFAPDHPSDLYSDGFQIVLFGKEVSQEFRVYGECKHRLMFLTGGDPIYPTDESLAIMTQPPEEVARPSNPSSYLLTFGALMQEDGTIEPANRVLSVGCCKSLMPNQKKKKGGEFTFDNIQVLTSVGFQVEPQRASVEAGTTKNIQFTWTPPNGYNSNQVLETSVILTTKGDTQDQHKILIRGLIVSDKNTLQNERKVCITPETHTNPPPVNDQSDVKSSTAAQNSDNIATPEPSST